MDEEFLQQHLALEQEAKENEVRILRAAEQRLSSVGLDMARLKDHASQGKVLDLGAGECYIGQAAKIWGLNGNVLSADKMRPKNIEDLGLNFQEFDATNSWPYGERYFRTIISRQGPLFMTETDREGAIYLLNHAMASLQREGGLRMFPSRFGYIKQQMYQEPGNYRELQNMSLRELLNSQKNNEYNLEANRRTKAELQELGFAFEVRQLNAPDVMSANQEYLVIKPH
jgi:hypothetical protein